MRHTHFLKHVVETEGIVEESPYSHSESETHEHDIPEGSVGPHTHYQVPGGMYWVTSDGVNHSGPLTLEGEPL